MENANNDIDRDYIKTTKEELIEQLMTLYGEEIKRLIFTYTKNWTRADDLTQDVFVSIFLKFDQFSGKSSLRTWIYSIAINKCKDFKRSWHFRNIQFVEKIFPFIKESGAEPETVMIKKSDNTFLFQQVMTLPIKYREVILLFYYKDFSIEEISSITGIHHGTVKTRLKRAREKLKVRLSAEKRGESFE